ncbi:MAG: hypothetical protein AAGJ50_08935 [Pseudomonadota bacterium]
MEKLGHTGRVTTLCFLGLLLGACTTVPQQQPEKPNAVSQGKNIRGMPGISGLAALSEDSFLVVHDAKARKPKKPRLGLLTTDHQEEKMRYTEIAAPEAISPPTSDLEDICAIPGSDGEFLVNESGTFEGLACSPESGP